ncbi:hypothetical protein AAHA92_20887 [Salvia divinorum]|uniref:Uncharacterized protein n=1 Tax=Salvia divinorum TaxID=28513 RepID=A0ABD1GLN1_SALDI
MRLGRSLEHPRTLADTRRRGLGLLFEDVCGKFLGIYMWDFPLSLSFLPKANLPAEIIHSFPLVFLLNLSQGRQPETTIWLIMVCMGARAQKEVMMWVDARRLRVTDQDVAGQIERRPHSS